MGDWKPFRVSHEGPNISHVFFADDLVLFAESDLSQMTSIQQCLETSCAAIGAKVSL